MHFYGNITYPRSIRPHASRQVVLIKLETMVHAVLQPFRSPNEASTIQQHMIYNIWHQIKTCQLLAPVFTISTNLQSSNDYPFQLVANGYKKLLDALVPRYHVCMHLYIAVCCSWVRHELWNNVCNLSPATHLPSFGSDETLHAHHHTPQRINPSEYQTGPLIQEGEV